MTDLNGSKKYPLQTLCRLFAAALPPGVPSLQAKAASAWALDPDSFLPGGKNAALLPALVAYASRITPKPPAKLEQFLQKTRGEAHLKKDWDSGTFSKEEKKKTLKDFAPLRKEKVQEIFNHIGGELKTSLPEISYVQINKSGVKEMLNPKAIWASLNLGTSLDIYLEILNDTRNLLQNKARVEKVLISDFNDPLKAKIYVETEKNASDGKIYIARYMIRIFKKKGMQPDLYFLNCRPK